jgi:hypothetical protein
MTTELQNHEAQTRPVFKFLAGFLGVLFLLGGVAAVIFAFQSTGPALWRWIVEASVFLLVGAKLLHAAFNGRWRLRR